MSKIFFNRLIEVVSERIKQMPGCVVLRKDISDIGILSQISRVLQILIKRYELVRMGQGIYAKTHAGRKPIIQGKVPRDLHRVILHRLAWDREPQGGKGVFFDKPTSTVGKEPLATIKLSDKPSIVYLVHQYDEFREREYYVACTLCQERAEAMVVEYQATNKIMGEYKQANPLLNLFMTLQKNRLMNKQRNRICIKKSQIGLTFIHLLMQPGKNGEPLINALRKKHLFVIISMNRLDG